MTRRRYIGLGIAGFLTFIVLLRRHPILWGMVNPEVAIGVWVSGGHYTRFQAFVLACVFGCSMALLWYFLLGKFGEKLKKWFERIYVVERQEAEKAHLTYYFGEIARYAEKRFRPDWYAKHWVYRVLHRIHRYHLLGPTTKLLGYWVMFAFCMIPFCEFPVLIFIRGFKVRFGIFAVLGGNIAKMFISTYGIWPGIFSWFTK